MPKVVDVEARRDELAAAAAQLIARAGVGAATLREVAAEAGWTTGAVTPYFADKRELLLHTFTSSLARRHRARDERGDLPAGEALVEALEGALPLDDDRRRHWMVTVAFCAHTAGDAELAAAQRDAYREFRAQVAGLVRRSGHGTGAAGLAERLIAVADGIAVQALFDPEGWPARRQVAQLHATVGPILAASRPGHPVKGA